MQHPRRAALSHTELQAPLPAVGTAAAAQRHRAAEQHSRDVCPTPQRTLDGQPMLHQPAQSAPIVSLP